MFKHKITANMDDPAKRRRQGREVRKMKEVGDYEAKQKIKEANQKVKDILGRISYDKKKLNKEVKNAKKRHKREYHLSDILLDD